jgi:hypothetical protein
MKADGFGIGQMLTFTYCFGVSLQSGPEIVLVSLVPSIFSKNHD